MSDWSPPRRLRDNPRRSKKSVHEREKGEKDRHVLGLGTWKNRRVRETAIKAGEKRDLALRIGKNH